jgi:hypothetical protein
MPNKQGPIKHAGFEPQRQRPSAQPSARIESQRIPQPPQWLRSREVSTHTSVQHCSRAPQVRPHAPQSATVSSRVQLPEQHAEPPTHAGPEPHMQRPDTQVSPGAHEGMHIAATQRPIEQVWPVAHATPQPPQCIGLLCTSTQPPPQQERPIGAHELPAPQRQVPSLPQVSPAGHGGSQTPPPASAGASLPASAGASLPASGGGGASAPAPVSSGTGRASARFASIENGGPVSVSTPPPVAQPTRQIAAPRQATRANRKRRIDDIGRCSHPISTVPRPATRVCPAGA